MKILNLGCGTKTSSHPDVVNIDWSPMLWLKNNVFLYNLLKALIDSGRREKLEKLPDNIVVHNLAKGIPFSDKSIDVVYHSHMLEHLDRDVAVHFLIEAKRVLKTGGIHRIVVPDFEFLCRNYLEHLIHSEANFLEATTHDNFISEIIEQSVRRESFGTSKQKKIRRFIENFLFGDARQRGETHQWMYDRINLTNKLVNAGYKKVSLCQFNTSSIAGWNEIGLDLNESGEQYKLGSLYIEAVV